MQARVRADEARYELGARVRRFREEAGWSREMLAAFAGSSMTGIKNVENGANWPTTDTLIRLALALGVPIEDRVDESGNPQMGLIPPRAYSDLQTQALSFLERRFAQSLPQGAALAGEKAASSRRSSQSSKAAGKDQRDTTRTGLAAVAKKPADKATKLRKVKDSHITIRRHVA